LVEALLRDGYEVRVLDNLDPQVHKNGAQNLTAVEKDIECMWGDVRNETDVANALRDSDMVVHFAAVVGVGQSMYEIVRYVDTNTHGTATLLQTLINGSYHVKKLIVASSMSIYGEGAYECRGCGAVHPGLRELPQMRAGDWELRCPKCGHAVSPTATDESKPLRPTSVYAITKRDQEEMCLAVGRAYGLPTVALRFFNIYGPRQSLANPYTGVGAIFSSRLINGNRPVIFEDGRQSRDFIHVSDIVQGVRLAMENEKADFEVFNVGTGKSMSVLEMATLLGERLGVEIAPQIVHQFREGDIRHCYADISKIRERLGFEPKVPFKSGINDLISWVREQSVEDTFQQAAAELKARRLTK
jgi:dTDP-L-rhamnose 4-epimerase